MKNISKIIACMVALTCSISAMAQGIIVTKKDGTTIKVPYSNFESISTYEAAGAVDKKTITINGYTFDMVLVEAGSFTMGSEDGEPDEMPVHKVTLTKDFYLATTEATQALWKAVLGDDQNTSWFQGDDLPVNNVPYVDVVDFISELNAVSGLNFRLPTEAEWEFAARGGNLSEGFEYYAGSNDISQVAWYQGNSGDPATPFAVAQKKTNELGLYDMTGNVNELTSTGYYDYTEGDVTDPVGADPNEGIIVFRGGSFFNSSYTSRITYRGVVAPAQKYTNIGFRLALDK